MGRHTGYKRPNASSKYIGVYWRKAYKKWQVRICNNGKIICIGHYDDEIEAAQAYDIKAKEIFGEDAVLNFPDKKEGYEAPHIKIEYCQTYVLCRDNNIVGYAHGLPFVPDMIKVNLFPTFRTEHDAIVYWNKLSMRNPEWINDMMKIYWGNQNGNEM